MRRPKCSILREPFRDDHTICTAVAPEDVFTVRTYATRAPYGHSASAQIRTRKTRNVQVTVTGPRELVHVICTRVFGPRLCESRAQ